MDALCRCSRSSTIASAAQEAAAAAAPTGGTPLLWWIAPLSSVAALVFAIYFYKKMMSSPPGNETMESIASVRPRGRLRLPVPAVQGGDPDVHHPGAIFAVLAYYGIQNPFVPVAFLTGGFFSGLCGFLGMKTATLPPPAERPRARRVSLNRGLQVAFRSGSVMGLVVVGFGLLDISLWYLILDKSSTRPST